MANDTWVSSLPATGAREQTTIRGFAAGLHRQAEELREEAKRLEEQRFQDAYNEHVKQFKDDFGLEPMSKEKYREEIYNPALTKEKARQSHSRVNTYSGGAGFAAPGA